MTSDKIEPSPIDVERAWIEAALNVLYSRGAAHALAELAIMIEQRTAAIGDTLVPEALRATTNAKRLSVVAGARK